MYMSLCSFGEEAVGINTCC